MDMARRSFLRGRPGEPGAVLRPPWALPEAEFTARCTRCGDCLPACPTGLLHAGPGNFPIADFSSSCCNFCGDCVAACQTGALAHEVSPPWSLSVSFNDACLTRQGVVCRSCGDACDARAIAFRPRPGGVAQPELDAAACTGCGECLTVCPTRAITIGRLAPASEETS